MELVKRIDNTTGKTYEYNGEYVYTISGYEDMFSIVRNRSLDNSPYELFCGCWKGNRENIIVRASSLSLMEEFICGFHNPEEMVGKWYLNLRYTLDLDYLKNRGKNMNWSGHLCNIHSK